MPNPQINTLQSQITALNSQIIALQMQLSAAQSTNAGLQAQIVALQDEINALNAEIVELTTPIVIPAPPPDSPPIPTTTGFYLKHTFNTIADIGPDSTTVPAPGRAFFAHDPGRNSPTVDAIGLRFDITSLSAASTAGSFWMNFSPDYSKRFGENEEFYVAWEQQFSQSFIDTFFFEEKFDANGVRIPGTEQQGGIKQAIITVGDTPTQKWNSCEAIGNVIQTYYQHRLPWAYNSCTGSQSHPAYTPFEENVVVDGNVTDFKLQNGTAPYCLYSNSGSGTGVGPGCVGWVPNRMMKFKTWTKVGPRNTTTNEFDNSEFKMWIDGVLVMWWRPGISGYFPLTAGPLAEDQRFGKVFLLPYMTNKDVLQVHPLCQTWYQNLVISDVDPDTLSSYPAWRQGKPVNQVFEIPNTARLSGVADYVSNYSGQAPENLVDAWNGFASIAEKNKWIAVCTSGHTQWWNGIIDIDFSLDAPQFKLVDKGSDPSVVNLTDAVFSDKRPVGRHVYTTEQVIGPKVFLFGCKAAYGINQGFGESPAIDAVDFTTAVWDDHAANGNVPFSNLGGTYPTATRDYRDGAVYYCGNYSIYKTLDGKTWEQTFANNGLYSWDQGPSRGNTAPCIDTKSNSIVCLANGMPYRLAGGLQIQSVNLTTKVLSQVTVTGIPTVTEPDANNVVVTYSPLVESVLEYDEDNDRYLYPQGGTLYAIDKVTGKAITLIAIPGPVDTVENRFKYFPKLGGVAYLPSFASNVLFMPTRS